MTMAVNLPTVACRLLLDGWEACLECPGATPSSAREAAAAVALHGPWSPETARVLEDRVLFCANATRYLCGGVPELTELLGLLPGRATPRLPPCADWAVFSASSGIAARLSRGRIAHTTRRLREAGICTPFELAACDSAALELFFGAHWGPDATLFTLHSSAVELFPRDWPIPPSPLPHNAVLLARLLEGSRPEDTPLGVRLADFLRDLGLPSSPAGLCPRQMTAALRRSRATCLTLACLTDLGAAVQTLHAFGSSLPCVRAGLRAWGSFCDTVGAPHFPASVATASRFSVVMRIPHTYGLYLSHVAKTCTLLGLPTAWKTSREVASIRAGLARRFPSSPRGGLRCSPATRSPRP